MRELAEFCQRHPQVLRERYAEGVLPEPRHHIKHSSGMTTRRWTLLEAEAIRDIFARVQWGDFAIKKRRSTERKKRMNL